jgi:ABC-type amino acid transport substrate-binding protein
VEHETPPLAIACLKTGSCDQLFLPLDARAAEIGDFSNPIFQFDYTLMVPAGSSIAKVADADPARRSYRGRGQSRPTNETHAPSEASRVRLAEAPEQTFALMRDGKADVMASTRLVLLDFSVKLAGARVLAVTVAPLSNSD